MRKLRSWISLIALILITVPAEAGVYHTDRPLIWPIPDSLIGWVDQSGDLQTYFPMPLPRDNGQIQLGPKLTEKQKKAEKEKRLQWEKKISALKEKIEKGKGTLDDRLNLSWFYLMHPDHAYNELSLREALLILDKGLEANPNDFRLLANLATVHQRQAELAADEILRRREWFNAQRALKKALDHWPEEYSDWTQERLAWVRRAEAFHLRLMELRSEEPVDLPERDLNVDALFGDVNFDRNGKYQVGGIDWKSARALPPDALLIVRQLLFWLPYDNRLRWLHAELLNVQGDISIAAQLMKDLRHNREFDDPTLLRNHYFALEDAVKKGKGKEELSKDTEFPNLKPPPKKMSPFTYALIGLGAGILMGMLLLMQAQEIRRRMTVKHSPSESAESLALKPSPPPKQTEQGMQASPTEKNL